MVTRIATVAFTSIDVKEVDVQVRIENGLPAFTIVGLADKAVEKMKLTARGYHRILRVARTLADLEGSERVNRLHVAEALTFWRIVPGRSPISLAAG